MFFFLLVVFHDFQQIVNQCKIITGCKNDITDMVVYPLIIVWISSHFSAIVIQ